MHYCGAPKAYHEFEEIGNIRTVFWVVAKEGGYGPLLGDEGSQDFFSQPDKMWWDGQASSSVTGGITWVAGRKINGLNYPAPESLQVVSLRTTGDVNASNFGRSSIGDTFHGALGELIVYSQPLSDLEIKQVER